MTQREKNFNIPREQEEPSKKEMKNYLPKIFYIIGFSLLIYLASYACSKQMEDIKTKSVYKTCIENYKKAVADWEDACLKIKTLYSNEEIDYNTAIKYAKSMPEYVSSPHFTF
jgi:hypothetical protein